jgi:N-acetyl-anhydromuramyl-L-alanine amidase AmpD
MSRSRILLATSALTALALAACGPNDPVEELEDGGIHLPGGAEDGGDQEDPAATQKELLGSISDAFDSASREFDIPAEILKSIAYAETRWEMVIGEQEFEGQQPAFGVMGLREQQVARAAELAGVTEIEAKFVGAANIRAAAALLDELAEGRTFDRKSIGAWAPVVAAYSGIEDLEGQANYVHTEVYEAVRNGIEIQTLDGVMAAMSGVDIQPDFQAPTPPPQAAQGPDYSKAIWRPSPNYSARPSGTAGKVTLVIIHTCEGAYSGCWSWLNNTQSGASAHYVVNSTGSEISQLVRESHKAWHIAATYKCSLNGGKYCSRDGSSSNNFTVGIEHAGYGSQKTWDNGLLDASAKLTCDITKDHGITRDKYHIVGHGQLQPYNRTDPGPNWPWTNYIQRVNNACGAAPPPEPEPQPQPQPQPNPDPNQSTIIIDSNNNSNNQSVAKIEVSGNWTSSSATPGYFNTGYWHANTAAVSDGATFSFYMPNDATKTIDAWWVAGSNRAAAAPFVIFNAAGTKLGTVNVDQRSNGSKWVQLGSWNFTKGWNKVVLSRWTAEGSVVIADAVRVR